MELAATITTLTRREFNQDASKAESAAENGPVIITDRGRPAHVLLTFADYKKLTSQRTRIADLLAMPGGGSELMYLLDTNVVSELRKCAPARPTLG